MERFACSALEPSSGGSLFTDGEPTLLAQIQESKYCPALKSESRGSLAGCLPVQLAWPLSLSACNAWRHCGLAGLRRNEIDKLPWSAFRWDEGVIRIERTDGDGT